MYILESEEDDLMYSYKKKFRKQYPAISSDEITIKAAKQTAKDLKLKVKDILKNITPDKNIQGTKTWDKDGNIK